MLRHPLRPALHFLGHTGYLLQQPLLSLPALNTTNPHHPVLHQQPRFQYYAYDFNHAFSLEYPRHLVTAVPKFKKQVQLKKEDVVLEEAVEDHDDDYSDTIRLRQMTLSDVDDLLEWSADENARKFWCPFMSKREAIRYIIHARIPHKAICLKDNNKPIGLISVTECGNKSSEIGYVLAPMYRGKGIMTKAVKMVASSIFVGLPHIEKIEAGVDFENTGSQRVLEKVGFSKNHVHTPLEFTFTLFPEDLKDN